MNSTYIKTDGEYQIEFYTRKEKSALGRDVVVPCIRIRNSRGTTIHNRQVSQVETYILSPTNARWRRVEGFATDLVRMVQAAHEEVV